MNEQTTNELAEVIDLVRRFGVEAVEHDIEAAVRLLVDLRDASALLRDAVRELESALGIALGPGEHVVGSVPVRVRRSTHRTGWHTDDLVRAVVARLLDEPGVAYDPETGEALPQSHVAHAIANGLRDCVSFGGGKVTGLRARGLDAEEFCTVGETTTTVQVIR